MRHPVKLAISAACLLALTGCDLELGDDDGEEIVDVKSELIDLAGAESDAKLDTVEDVADAAGAVLAIVDKLGIALGTTADAAAEGGEASEQESKITQTESCSGGGEREIDVSTTSVLRGRPDVDVDFRSCIEEGLTIDGLARLRCDNLDCERGKAILGEDSEPGESNELKVSNSAAGLNILFAGVGDYEVRSQNPLDADFRANLKSQAAASSEQINFQTGNGANSPLSVSIQESANFTQVELNGFIGIGVASNGSQCGGGRFDVETLSPLQIGNDGGVLGGSMTLKTPGGEMAQVNFNNDGSITVELADGTTQTLDASELNNRCDI